MPLLDADAVDRAIKIGECNVYHGCVHNMLHEKSEDILRGLYKSASFTVQAIVFRQTGKYVSQLADLLEIASPDEGAVIETFISIKNGEEIKLDEMSGILFNWAKKHIDN